jgi:hypothetical protein
VGIGVYTLFSLLKGPIGAASYESLRAEQEKLEAHLESLKVINKELELTKNALMFDKDTITVYARDLGYRLPRERFVRIVGVDGTKKQRIEPGELLTAAEPEYLSDKAIKICAFCIALGTFLCILIPEILQGRTPQPAEVRGRGRPRENRGSAGVRRAAS